MKIILTMLGMGIFLNHVEKQRKMRQLFIVAPELDKF